MKGSFSASSVQPSAAVSRRADRLRDFDTGEGIDGTNMRRTKSSSRNSSGEKFNRDKHRTGVGDSNESFAPRYNKRKKATRLESIESYAARNSLHYIDETVTTKSSVQAPARDHSAPPLTRASDRTKHNNARKLCSRRLRRTVEDHDKVVYLQYKNVDASTEKGLTNQVSGEKKTVKFLSDSEEDASDDEFTTDSSRFSSNYSADDATVLTDFTQTTVESITGVIYQEVLLGYFNIFNRCFLWIQPSLRNLPKAREREGEIKRNNKLIFDKDVVRR
mmetsp:Transcript_71/g.124  ORF Transcript_71/g.124 Transcript_71/m.124 type:complete len:276 (-) Transcript_71:131-958(-)